MKYVIPFALVCVLAPAMAVASGRWDHGDRGGHDRGYRYDRGERHYDRGHSRSRNSFGFSFGYSTGRHWDSGYSSINYRYSNRGYGWPSERSYRPPVVVREVHVSPRYECSPGHYDSGPAPRHYSAPSVYYYDGGSSHSGSVYYFRK